MNMRIIAALLLALGAAGWLPASAAPSGNGGAEAQIRRLNQREVAGLMHQDVKMLTPIWADTFVVTNPYNKFITKADVVRFVASGGLGFTAYERHIDYLHVYGNTAIVAGSETVAWAGHMPLAGKTSQLRFTSVWMKHANGWQEVARHANIVATHPTAQHQVRPMHHSASAVTAHGRAST